MPLTDENRPSTAAYPLEGAKRRSVLASSLGDTRNLEDETDSVRLTCFSNREETMRRCGSFRYRDDRNGAGALVHSLSAKRHRPISIEGVTFEMLSFVWFCLQRKPQSTNTSSEEAVVDWLSIIVEIWRTAAVLGE